MSAENRDSSGRLTRFVTKQGKGVLLTRLWKKNPAGEKIFADNWTRRVVRNNRQYYFPLPADKDKAEQIANELEAFLQVRSNTIDMAIAKFCPDKAGPGAPGRDVATIAEIAKVYKAKVDVVDVKKSSGNTYVGSLLRMIALVRAHRARASLALGEPMSDKRRAAVLDARVDVLNEPGFYTDFKTAMLGGVSEDRAIAKQRKRTINSYLRNTRSLFTDEARRHYAAAGLNVPPLPALENEPPYRKVDTRYQLPEVRVINAVFDLGRELRDGRPAANGHRAIKPDRNAYLAYLGALHGGLRKQEIAHWHRSWFTETAPWRIRIQADGAFDPKGSEGETQIEDWVYREVMALGGKDYILSGTLTERGDDVFRRLNKRLRGAGMHRRLPTHELRKLFGSYIATTQGLFVAQKFLRHRSAQLTSDDYADNMVDELVRSRWKQAV